MAHTAEHYCNMPGCPTCWLLLTSSASSTVPNVPSLRSLIFRYRWWPYRGSSAAADHRPSRSQARAVTSLKEVCHILARPQDQALLQ